MLITEEQPPEDGTTEEQVSLYTCYVTPCPEEQNSKYKPPEFMLCYRSPSDDGSHPEKVKYYCSPVEIRLSDGNKGVFEFRIIQDDDSTKEENSESLPKAQVNLPETSDSQNPIFTATYITQPCSCYCTSNHHQFCSCQQMYTGFQRPFCSNFNPNFTYSNVKGNIPRKVHTHSSRTATQ